MVNKQQSSEIFIFILAVFFLFDTYQHSRWSPENLYALFKEDKDLKVIPVEVLNIKKIAKRNIIQDFRLDQILNENIKIHQRSTEYLYPILLNAKSSYIFTSANKNYKNICNLIDKEQMIELYECKKN